MSSDGLDLEGAQSHFPCIVLAKDQVMHQTNVKGGLAVSGDTVEEFAITFNLP